MRSTVCRYREELIESISATDNALLERYLEGGEIDRDAALHGTQEAMARLDLFPLFCASADSMIGVRALLTELVQLMPNAYDMEEIHALTGAEGDQTIRLHARTTGPSPRSCSKRWPNRKWATSATSACSPAATAVVRSFWRLPRSAARYWWSRSISSRSRCPNASWATCSAASRGSAGTFSEQTQRTIAASCAPSCRAVVTHSKLHLYATQLFSLKHGHGQFVRQFNGYEQVSGQAAQKIVAEAVKEREAVEA